MLVYQCAICITVVGKKPGRQVSEIINLISTLPLYIMYMCCMRDFELTKLPLLLCACEYCILGKYCVAKFCVQ